MESIKVFLKGEKTSEEISKRFGLDPREVGAMYWNKKEKYEKEKTKNFRYS